MSEEKCQLMRCDVREKLMGSWVLDLAVLHYIVDVESE